MQIMLNTRLMLAIWKPCIWFLFDFFAWHHYANYAKHKINVSYLKAVYMGFIWFFLRDIREGGFHQSFFLFFFFLFKWGGLKGLVQISLRLYQVLCRINKTSNSIQAQLNWSVRNTTFLFILYVFSFDVNVVNVVLRNICYVMLC